MMISSPATDLKSPVLLPPRASQVYAYLLTQEKAELDRGAEASWERLMHVRHLKDRMISGYSRLFARSSNLSRKQQGSAGAWLALALHMAKRFNFAPSSLLPILPSRYIHFRSGFEQLLIEGFRNWRNGTGIDMIPVMFHHPSFRGPANRTLQASTLTVLVERAASIVPPVLPV